MFAYDLQKKLQKVSCRVIIHKDGVALMVKEKFLSTMFELTQVHINPHKTELILFTRWYEFTEVPLRRIGNIIGSITL